jgi:hypothetical protein
VSVKSGGAETVWVWVTCGGSVVAVVGGGVSGVVAVDVGGVVDTGGFVVVCVG